MEQSSFKPVPYWSTILLISVVLCAFVIPVLPVSMGKISLRIGSTLIFLSGCMSLKERRWSVLIASGVAFVLEWVSGIFDLQVIPEASKAMNALLFLMVVFFLIKQVASAREVNTRMIVESVTGYLLLGLVFAGIVAAVMERDPLAFNLPVKAGTVQPAGQSLSEPFYFVFLTLATVGYGDIVPLKPYARSLATFIGISGQLYIAIIIALLVGKFAGRRKHVIG
ncbi:MAG: potassium channel family protein [Bacteroidota bacterium]